MSLCNNLLIFCTISLGYQRIYSSAIKEDGQVITFGGKNINENTGGRRRFCLHTWQLRYYTIINGAELGGATLVPWHHLFFGLEV